MHTRSAVQKTTFSERLFSSFLLGHMLLVSDHVHQHSVARNVGTVGSNTVPRNEREREREMIISYSCNNRREYQLYVRRPMNVWLSVRMMWPLVTAIAPLSATDSMHFGADEKEGEREIHANRTVQE